MRSNVSATAGVVVGVVCKIGSVLLNLVIWDQHATTVQLAFLSLGLAGKRLAQQLFDHSFLAMRTARV